MLAKTYGIVFHRFRYSDSAVIVRIFTENFGLQSYLIRGVYSRKGKMKIALFQPGTILEMVVAHKNRDGLQYIRDARVEYTYNKIYFDQIRQSLLIFIIEVLNHTIKIQESEPDLFAFIAHSLRELDAEQCCTTEFHLLFLVRFSKYLGFAPDNNYSDKKPFFDLMEGSFTERMPAHGNYIDKSDAHLLSKLIATSDGTISEISLSSANRSLILEKLLKYYSLHIHGFGEILSHQILHTILR